jgi:hypothetical protein
MTTWTLNEKLIMDTASDDPPKAVKTAQAFAAAVEKLDTPSGPVDLTSATTSTVGKLLEQAVTADLGAEVRARHLASLRDLAAERLERAWRESFAELGERFRRDFDQAADELTEELEKWPGVTGGALTNMHDHRGDRLRDIIRRLDAGKALRACYPRANLTHNTERDLSGYAVLADGARSAINFRNRSGRPKNAALWLALSRSEDILANRWQDTAQQMAQAGPAKQQRHERQLADRFSEVKAERRRVSAQ